MLLLQAIESSRHAVKILQEEYEQVVQLCQPTEVCISTRHDDIDECCLFHPVNDTTSTEDVSVCSDTAS